MKVVGILALQGDFSLHAEALTNLNTSWLLVRQPADLEKVSGLIIPGGESSTLLKLMHNENWQDVFKRFCKQGKVLLGTCAGLILLAKKVEPAQHSFALLDVSVERNAYGRQIDSFMAQGKLHVRESEKSTITLTFIRAPKIIACGAKIDVLASYKNEPVWVREGNVMGATFHPEMGDDKYVHQYFIKLLKDF